MHLQESIDNRVFCTYWEICKIWRIKEWNKVLFWWVSWTSQRHKAIIYLNRWDCIDYLSEILYKKTSSCIDFRVSFLSTWLGIEFLSALCFTLKQEFRIIYRIYEILAVILLKLTIPSEFDSSYKNVIVKVMLNIFCV